MLGAFEIAAHIWSGFVRFGYDAQILGKIFYDTSKDDNRAYIKCKSPSDMIAQVDNK